MEEQQPKDRIEELLEENLKLNREIYDTCVKVKKYMFASQIYSIVKIFFIVIPIVVAIIFLLPLFSQVSPYIKELMGPLKSGNADIQSFIK